MGSGSPVIVQRAAGAPRLIEWTGERCVPWAPDPQVVYEHLHRYLWAASLLSGRRVLDLASGEGFGAAILATTADSVLGVDIDAAAIAHSRAGYHGPNLRFDVADALDLSLLPEHGFDAVVAFELIEHLSDHRHVIAQIRRLLAPGGLLVVSTPNRSEYARFPNNGAGAVELERHEFQSLLASSFANVATFGQRAITGSALSAMTGGTLNGTANGTGGNGAPGNGAPGNGAPGNGAPGNGAAGNGATHGTVFVEREDEWRLMPGIRPTYLVSLASDAALPLPPHDSTLADCGIELLRWIGGSTAERDRELERGREVIVAQAADLARTRRGLALAHLRSASEHEHVRALEHRYGQAVSGYEGRVAALGAELHEVRRTLLRIDESVSWQLFLRCRAWMFARLGGENSRRVAALQASLRVLGRTLHAGGAGARGRETEPATASRRAATPAPIRFPVSDHPEVSIVMPVHAHVELTAAALESIREHTPFPEFELIVVDDSQKKPMNALLARLEGARVVVNDSNLGYIESVARGAGLARGRWLVLCNNDIVVRPGWLDTMLECAESSPDIAVVTPKYIYPDRRLAEAGGLIWRDGSGANYGRGQEPARCHYEFRRDVDYGSAAALLVRTDVWRRLGGFDERFAPMYYEDADFCFAVRAAGMRVVYEPGAEVIHAEGATAGVDETAGHKRHQTTNRPRFEQKWRGTLESHLKNDQSMSWHAATRHSPTKVLVIDHTVPMWDRDAGSLRMREILKALVALRCHVTFLPDNLLPVQPYTRELQRLGVEVLYGIDPHEVLRRIGPSLSLALLSRPHPTARWLDLIREYAPNATIAYDTVDLHWLREARRAATGHDAPGAELRFSPRSLALRELEQAMMRAADTTIVVTQTEADRVRADVPGTSVHVLPIGNRLRALVPPPEVRSGIVFVGGFVHPPNVDAALVLAREVMPRVWREQPETTLTIVGSDPPPELAQLASRRLVVSGWVEDLEPLLGEARALVAPLRFGAGLKGKVTQALAEGLPVVTTPIGAEGLDAVDGEHLLIGVGAEEIAAQTIRLLSDDVVWRRLSTGGQLLIADRGSPDAIAAGIRRLLVQRSPAVRA